MAPTSTRVRVDIQRLGPAQGAEEIVIAASTSDTRTELLKKIDAELAARGRPPIRSYQIYVGQKDRPQAWVYGARTVGKCLEGASQSHDAGYEVFVREIDPSSYATSACCTVL